MIIAVLIAATVGGIFAARYLRNRLTPGERAAKEAYDYLKSARVHKSYFDPREFQALTERIDPRGVRWLIRRYREALASGVHDGEALDVMTRFGGPDVTDLLLERLAEPRKTEIEHGNLMLWIGGTSGWSSLAELRIDHRFRGYAEDLLKSDSSFDRRGGCGLLGWLPSDASRRALEASLSGGDPKVQAAAAKSLGRIGDANSLVVLKAWAGKPDNLRSEHATRHVLKAVERIESRIAGRPDAHEED